MKKRLKVYISLVLLFFSCTQISPLDSGNYDSSNSKGLDIITWNLEHFPIHPLTPAHTANVIDSIQIDIAAFQEIENLSDFQTITQFLPGWGGFRSGGNSGWQELAFIWDSSTVTNTDFYEIYTDNSSAFPRPPLVMECIWDSTEFVIINNHLKCCGDGILNSDEWWDEEYRRLQAAILLEEYIAGHFDDKNVILVGDLNDILTDFEENNVFNVFLNQPEKYLFVDEDIAVGSAENWSYPGWPSHIDHILITDELFPAFQNSHSKVLTLNIEYNFTDGLAGYYHYLSDHRPVYLKLVFE